MEIEYELTEEDVIAFNLYHVKNSKVGKNSLQWQRFVSPMIFFMFAYFLSIFTDMEKGPLFLVFGLTAILWVILYPKYFYFHITRQVRKMLKEGKNEGLIGQHIMKMNKTGITDQTQVGETKVQWSGIQRVIEDADYLYIYTSTISAYILPKRTIYSVDGLKAYVEKRITSN
ncbi:YcxB family protein [Sporosarcina sp. PTS2304]|uniref:YcxB family protein n=1 Tax=Sporosarcina sp. PTS2304 TaxID=2283194 RepID=UPI000E0D5285|nr:YcxB family protein [Sporosarcina sp. PTS2304]AXI00115.1 YcxB family protein [Sporosarcina sp. PTS2304]